MTTFISRRASMLSSALTRWLALLVTAILAAGCAGGTQAAGPRSTAETETSTEASRTVEHLAGTTEVAATPQRVATDSEVVAGHLASVGLLPVAGPDEVATWLGPYADAGLLDGLDLSGIQEIGTTEEFDLEALVRADPDLIVVEDFSIDRYDTLSDIAPTVVITRPTNAAWQDAFDQTVTAVGRQAEATVVRDRYARVLEAVPPGAPDTVVSFLRGAGPGQFRLDALGGFGGSVAQEAGYQVDVGGVDEDEAGEGQITFSNEQLGVVTGDLLVTTTQAEGGPSNIDELEASPLWQQIPAVEAGRILALAQPLYNGGTYVAAELLLTAINARLDEAAPVAARDSTAGPTGAADTEESAGLPTTVTGADGVTVEITSAERIIPLDGDVAEIVFALGLGDKVVATDLSATHPREADELPEIGYQRALSVEPIVGFKPTVLLATDIAGPPETLEALREEFDIPLVVVPSPNDPTGPATKIRAVADALGVPARGEQLARQVQAEVDDAIALAEQQDTTPSVIALYLRGETTQLVLGEDSSIHWMLEVAGGADLGSQLGEGRSFPIEAESLVAAAPDVLVVTAGGLASVGGMEGFLQLPGIAGTPAAVNGRVLAYDDQLLLGNGPRTGQMLQTLVRDLHGLLS